MHDTFGVDTPICFTSNFLGSQRHRLYTGNNNEYIEVDQIPKSCWKFDKVKDGVSACEGNSLNDLLYLNGYHNDYTKIPSQYEKIIQSIKIDASKKIYLQYIMRADDYEKWITCVYNTTKEYIRKCHFDYFMGTWWVGNTVLKLFGDIHIDYEKVNKLIKIGLPLHYFDGFITLDGKCSKLVYNRFGMKTGRMTIASGPDVNKFPKKLRGLLRPSHERYKIYSLDISAIEPQSLSYVVHNESEKHTDFYASVQSNVRLNTGKDITRNIVKKIVISEMYGSGVDKIIEELGDESPSRQDVLLIKTNIEKYLKTNEMKRKLIDEYKRCGYIKNFLSRKIFTDPHPHVLLNNFCQSTGADLSLLLFKEAIETYPIRPLFTVFDALFFEIDAKYSIPSEITLESDAFRGSFKCKIEEVKKI